MMMEQSQSQSQSQSAGVKRAEQLESEIEDIQHNIEEIMRRMSRLAAEDKELNTKTMEELSVQGERLNRVELELDSMAVACEQGRGTLVEMNKFLGLFSVPWRRSIPKPGEEFDKTYKPKKSWWGWRSSSLESTKATNTMNTTSTIPCVNNDRTKINEPQDEIDVALGYLLKDIRLMKRQALMMGDEMERQNHHLDQIKQKMSAVKAHVISNSKGTEFLLK
eukprot:m.5317 g.5317  ORF g.5317 m.5317 type:complete len:221 (-) comp2380_c0_seq1:67-729(-)